jgi:hypothetical protein
MMTRVFAGAAALAAALVLPSSALALDLKFHPNGGGAHSYASWKGQEGLADSTGDANQGFYLEHGDASADGAAGIVTGLEDLSVQLLNGLAYEYDVKSGKCGVTDPRWTLFIRSKGGKHYAVSLGCAAAVPSPGSAPGWIRRTTSQAAIRLQVLRKGGTDALNGTITGLALAYDTTVGSIMLDNITVTTKLGSQTWTCAADNGQGDASPLAFTDEQLALLAEPLTADEQTYEEDLLASATEEEWAAIQQEPDPAA